MYFFRQILGNYKDLPKFYSGKEGIFSSRTPDPMKREDGHFFVIVFFCFKSFDFRQKSWYTVVPRERILWNMLR